MRTHAHTGKPVHVVLALNVVGARCTLCANDLKIGVKICTAPDQDYSLFCRPCAKAIGRVGGALQKSAR